MLRELDQLQADEPKRPHSVEAIFHPIPSVEPRLALPWFSESRSPLQYGSARALGDVASGLTD